MYIVKKMTNCPQTIFQHVQESGFVTGLKDDNKNMIWNSDDIKKQLNHTVFL